MRKKKMINNSRLKLLLIFLWENIEILWLLILEGKDNQLELAIMKK